MTDRPCPTCGEAIRDSGAICWPCARRLRGTLTSLAGLLAELETTTCRQTSSSPPWDDDGGHSASKPVPFDLKASEAALTLRTSLKGWIRVLADELAPECQHASCGPQRPACDRSEAHVRLWVNVLTTGPAEWLAERIEDVRMRDWAEVAYDEIREAARNGWKAIDRPPERAYAGHCSAEWQADDGPVICGSPMYGRMDHSDVRCPACGSVYDVVECRRAMLDAAADWLVTSGEASRALTKLGDPVTPEVIRQRRKRARDHGQDPAPVQGYTHEGRPRYRLGDLVALVRGAA